MAALRRGFAIIGSVTMDGLPLTKRRQLQVLQNLYLENDYILQNVAHENEAESDRDSNSSAELERDSDNEPLAGPSRRPPDVINDQDFSAASERRDSPFNSRAVESTIFASIDKAGIDSLSSPPKTPGSNGWQPIPGSPSEGSQSVGRTVPTLDSLHSSLPSVAGSPNAATAAKNKARRGLWKWGPRGTAKDISEFFLNIQKRTEHSIGNQSGDGLASKSEEHNDTIPS